MRRSQEIALWMALMGLMSLFGLSGLAQDSGGLTLSTPYPAQAVQAGETVTLSLRVKSENLPPQIVKLEMQQVPKGWKATFLGGGRVVRAVYVEPDETASVSLKLEPPADASPGTYRFVAAARGESAQAELPLELIVEEKLPPQLALEVELPVLRGSPGSTLRYRATLENESDQELLANLSADAPQGFQVTFKTRFGSQEVTSLPLKPGESKELDIEVTPPERTSAGDYSVDVRAQAGDVEATARLAATVTGAADLRVSTPEGRLSRRATIGRETSLKVVVHNTGSAPARDVELSASPPADWTVKFGPERIAEIPPGGQGEATALITPSQKAIAGDYMVTIRARTEGSSDSAEIRITAEASTLWGAVGIALIAVALGVVGLAVVRYGRR